MTRLFTLLCSVLITLSIQAQDISKIIHQDDAAFFARLDAVPYGDGYLMAISASTSGSSDFGAIKLYKMDAHLNVEWGKRIAHENEATTGLHVRHIEPLPNGNFLMIGRSFEHGGSWHPDMVWHIDEEGMVLWSKQIEHDYSSSYTQAFVLGDGSVALMYKVDNGNTVFSKISIDGEIHSSYELNVNTSGINLLDVRYYGFEIIDHSGHLLYISNDLTSLSVTEQYTVEALEGGRLVKRLSDGGRVFLNAVDLPNDIFRITKEDASANVVWSKDLTFSGPTPLAGYIEFSSLGPEAITETNDGDIFFTFSRSSQSPQPPGNNLICLMTADGQVKYVRLTETYHNQFYLENNYYHMIGLESTAFNDEHNIVFERRPYDEPFPCDIPYDYAIVDASHQLLSATEDYTLTELEAHLTSDVSVNVSDLQVLESETFCGDVVISTENLSLESIGLEVYPNPSTGLVTIVADYAIEEVMVYNIAGQLVHHSKETALDLSGLGTGMFMVKVVTEVGISGKLLRLE